MALLIRNISQLITLRGGSGFRKGKELSEIGVIEDASVFIDGGVIVSYGREGDVLSEIPTRRDVEVVDCGGRVVMPSFVDCHTHSVFAKPRIEDFEMRLSGVSYSEIKRMGGGINLSARHIREATEDDLLNNLLNFASRFIECGTTSIEVKSGYGLDLENELKILRVIKKASEMADIEMIPTFLGAHSIPDGFDSVTYLDYLKREVLPKVADEKLAYFVDIFCERGYFGVDESIDYLNYAKGFGFIPRVHADQLSKSGGCLVAYKVGAVSADHLDWADDDSIDLLSKGGVSAVFLPASNYFLSIDNYPNARRFIERGCAVVLSTDFNPGTSPCWNMQFVISLAVLRMGMRIEEAIVSSIYNPSVVLGISSRCGMVERGMQADLIILDIKNYKELAYYFGSNINWMTIKKGRILWQRR